MEALDFPEFRQYSTWEKCSCDSSSNESMESLLIYHEITHTSSRDTRKNAEFVLVYNPERVRLNAVQRKSIHMARLGHKSCPLYDLDKFHGVWVRRAYMMTAQEFAEKMAEIICV